MQIIGPMPDDAWRAVLYGFLDGKTILKFILKHETICGIVYSIALDDFGIALMKPGDTFPWGNVVFQYNELTSIETID